MGEKTRYRATAEGLSDSPSTSNRTTSPERLRRFEFGPFQLDPSERILLRGSEIVPLAPKAFDTLHLLVRNSGHLLEKDEMIRALWPDTFVEDGSLSNIIFVLRKALGEDPAFIETVPRRGYRFVGAVLQLPHAPPPQLERPQAGLGVPQVDANWNVDTRPRLLETAAPPSQSDSGPGYEARDEGLKGWSRERYRSWMLPGAGVLAATLAFSLWYVKRPLPQPRISEYAQLTFDGHGKNAAGTDGSRLYFSLDYVFGIRQMPVAGGESEPIPIDLPNPFLFPGGLSPDGSSMLIFSQEGNQLPRVSIVREPGRSVRFLTEAVSATWSPDGKSVAYATVDGNINLIRRDGTGARKLAGVGGRVDSLSWSPDGRTIRFCKDLKLWEMSSDGSNPHELLPNWRPSYARYFGQWTPDGEYFIFGAGERGQPGSNFLNGLWALDERHAWFGRPSAEPVKLTSEPMRWGWPLPSKDGKKIFADGFIDRGELVRFNSKSGKFEPVLGGISAEFVDFSRDGKFVVYVSYPGGILWKANLDGSKPVQLSEPPMYPQQPRFSPDGSQIAFMAASTDSPYKAYVVSSAGGGPRLLFADDKGAQDNPNWSPDGRRVAFSRTPAIRLPQPDVHGNTPGVVYILDLANHRVGTLPGSEGYFSPRWSPDGRFIEAESDNGLNLKVFDLVTHRAWVVETGTQAEWHTWSRDGRFIYFESLQGHPGVFRIPAHGGNREMVVDLKGFLSTGIGGSYFTLDPADAPLVLHFNGSDEIYALTFERK